MNSIFKQVLAKNISVGNDNPDPTYAMDINGLIGNSVGNHSGNFIDISNGLLWDSNPTASLDWQNKLLSDSVSLAVDWTNRKLYPNNMTTETVNWQSNVLSSIETIGFVNFGFPSVNWQNRQLWYADDSGFNQYAVLSWESGTCVSPFDHTTTIDFFHRILSGNWSGTSFYVSGYSVVTTNQTGAFITTGQTGNFASSSIPSSILLTGITGNLSVNWNSGNFYYYTLSGNTNFTFTGQKDGQTISIFVNNTGSNSYTGIFSGVKWPNQANPVQSSGALTDIYTFKCLTGIVYGTVIKGY